MQGLKKNQNIELYRGIPITGINPRKYSGGLYMMMFGYDEKLTINYGFWEGNEPNFRTPEEAVNETRSYWTEILEKLVESRDKNNLWRIATDSRESITMAIKLLKGGVDLVEPKIVNAVYPHLT